MVFSRPGAVWIPSVAWVVVDSGGGEVGMVTSGGESEEQPVHTRQRTKLRTQIGLRRFSR